MDFKKLVPILGLFLLILLVSSTVSASDIDLANGMNSSDSNMDLTANQAIYSDDSMDSSSAIDLELVESDADGSALENACDGNLNDDNSIIYEKESASALKNDLKASKLSSVYKITQSDYSSYFNGSGNVLSSVNAGDTLDFSGSFSSKDFIIDIPLTLTSSDGTAIFLNCTFKFNEGSDGSSISNLKMNSSRTDSPLIYLNSTSNMNIINNDVFSSGSKSYALCFNNVSHTNVFYNTFQTTGYVTGWGHPSALALSGTTYNNISSNNVIVNDSNGIYFTTYVGDSINPNLINSNNYIFNNTVHSVRGVEWPLDDNGNVPIPSSFCYAIQVMGSMNQLINNTVYNAYRGISSTGSNSTVSGNVVYGIKGTWYSGNTLDEGGDFGINVGTNSIVENNTIYDSHFNKTSGAAISAGSNSIVSNNEIRNIEGLAADLSKNNITFKNNNLTDIDGDGVRVKGAYGNITIEDNRINSTGNSISLVKASRTKYPSDIYISDNELNSQDGVSIYYEEQYMGHLVVDGVTIIDYKLKNTVTVIDFNQSNITLGDSVVIAPLVSSNGSAISGNVNVLINGEIVATFAIGSNYTFTPSEAGNYSISASFNATDEYESSVSSEVVLKVLPVTQDTKDTECFIVLDNSNVTLGDSVVIAPSVSCEGSPIEGTVDILVDNVKVGSVDIGSNYIYTPSEAGSFNISASFGGYDLYNPSGSEIVVLTVNPASSGGNGTNESGNGTASNGTDDNGTASNGTDTNGTNANGTDVNGTNGTNGTDSNAIDTNGTNGTGDSNQTDSSIIVINDDSYYSYFDDSGYPINLSYDGNYTLVIDSISNKDITIPSGFNINITGKDGSGTIYNGTVQIGDGSDELESISISNLTFDNYNKDAIVINEVVYEISIENNKISIVSEATKDNPYFSIYAINAVGYMESLNVDSNEISVSGTAPYIYGLQLGAYGASGNPNDISITNNNITLNSSANMGMAEGIYLDSPVDAVVSGNSIDIESVNDVYVYGMQVADSAYISIGEGKSGVKSPHDILLESNDLNLKSEYMVYGITVLDYGCDGSVDDMGKANTNMIDLNTRIIGNSLVANSTRAVMGIAGRSYNMSVLNNSVTAFGGSIEGVASHDALGVDNYALGVQYSSGGDYTVLVKDNIVDTNVTGEFLNNEAYRSFVSFINNTVNGVVSGNGTEGNVTNNTNDTSGNSTNGTSGNATDNSTDNSTNGTSGNATGNETGDNQTNSSIRTAMDLQQLIDNATSGSVIDLGNYEYVNVSGINIDKDIALVGNNTIISTAGDSKPVFNIKEGLSSVSASGIEFRANNGDVLFKANAVNSTERLAIEAPAINISGNAVAKASDDVVAESITVLELDSSRGVLAPTKPIVVSNNTLESGMDPFSFVIESVADANDVQIKSGGDVADRKLSVIHYEDMVTAAVNSKVEGRTGKYFVVNLTDDSGNPLEGRIVQIGFNGRIYNKTTDENGSAELQINLAYTGTYTFAVSYLGDNEYNASFVVAKIKVNTQKTKIATNSKTYKASAKTKSLTATLKDSKGNAIQGKTLKFTVNGKTYSAKTNAKGVATVKVSLSTKKTYSFTVKYAGDYTYAASSASSKVVIK